MFDITLQGSYLKFRKYTSKIMFCLKVWKQKTVLTLSW
jgi:hypothetical protein